MSCPCGNSFPYEQCCGRYIDMDLLPPSSEALMRSRYTAFVFGKINYLRKTMQGKALKVFNFVDLKAWLGQITWQGLVVVKSRMKTKTQGYVTFEAKYLEGGALKMICEKSEFKKIKGKWFYIDGKSIRNNTNNTN